MPRYQQAIGKTGIYFESVLHLKDPKIVVPSMRLDQISNRLSDYYRMDKQVRLGRPGEVSNYHDTILGTFKERSRRHLDQFTDAVIYDFTYYRQAIKPSDVKLIESFVDTQPDMSLNINNFLITLTIIEEIPHV